MTTISFDYCMSLICIGVFKVKSLVFKAGSGHEFSFRVRANRSGALKACMCYK